MAAPISNASKPRVVNSDVPPCFDFHAAAEYTLSASSSKLLHTICEETGKLSVLNKKYSQVLACLQEKDLVTKADLGKLEQLSAPMAKAIDNQIARCRQAIKEWRHIDQARHEHLLATMIILDRLIVYNPEAAKTADSARQVLLKQERLFLKSLPRDKWDFTKGLT